MIYMWELPEYVANKEIAAYDDQQSPNRFLFMQGRKLQAGELNAKLIFNVEVSREQIQQYDCIPDNIGSPLVNEKIINILLATAPSDVQFIDVEVRCKDGVLSNYKMLNVTSLIKGIDHDRSIYTKMKNADAILRFKYLTYKSGCMGSHKLARDEEYEPNLLATEEIKAAFEKENITGIWFVRPEDFYRPLTPQDVIDYNSDN